MSKSAYQEAGIAVSRTVRMEVGMLGIGMAMSLGPATAMAVAVAYWAVAYWVSWATGEARVRVVREIMARSLRCILTMGERVKKRVALFERE